MSEEKTMNINSENDLDSSIETYEKMMEELVNSLKIVEDKNSNLADVIKAYDKGVKAHRDCVNLLAGMEQRVFEISAEKQVEY